MIFSPLLRVFYFMIQFGGRFNRGMCLDLAGLRCRGVRDRLGVGTCGIIKEMANPNSTQYTSRDKGCTQSKAL